MNMVLTKKVMTLFLLALITIGGCSSGNTEPQQRVRVTEAQVEAFKSQKSQKRVDIYVPISEQYKSSGHGESLKNLLKAGARVKPRCYQCHSGEYFVAPENQKPDPSKVTLSITCAVCHEMTIKEFKLRLSPLETCTSCHNAGKEIVAGEVVHHPQKEMFLGIGAIGVPQTPDSKYKAGLTCIECHMPNEAHTFAGKTPAQAIKEHTESICVMCHADQSEQQFAEEVASKQDQIKNGCETLKKGLKTAKEEIARRQAQGIDVSNAQTVYNTVYTNISFIEGDRSMGIHNFEYANRILDYSRKQQSQLDSLLGL